MQSNDNYEVDYIMTSNDHFEVDKLQSNEHYEVINMQSNDHIESHVNSFECDDDISQDNEIEIKRVSNVHNNVNEELSDAVPGNNNDNYNDNDNSNNDCQIGKLSNDESLGKEEECTSGVEELNLNCTNENEHQENIINNEIVDRCPDYDDVTKTDENVER